MNIHIYISIFQKPLFVVLAGCGLHARAPQLKPLPDVVHRTTNGVVREGAVAMELCASIFRVPR